MSEHSARSGRSRSRPWWTLLPPAWTITAAASVAYLIAAPPSPDLAAAGYRSYLFSHAGFTLWDNSWYGGHHLLAYSVLAPALGALLGPQPLAAISMVIATALFAILVRGCFAARPARVAAAWFALGASVALLSSRVPFDLGLAVGLAAALAAQRRRLAPALALSVLCALASPVAGAFAGLAFLAWALAGGERAWASALALASLAPIGALALAFPEGGTQPYVASAFYPELAGVLAIAALIESAPAARAAHAARTAALYAGAGGLGSRAAARTARALSLLRVGLALYALALIGSYLLPTAVGGNVDRLGAIAAGPVAACALVDATRLRRIALAALAPLLLYWQANAPVADFAAAASDPSVHASYYAPLLGELRALGVGYGARPVRIEVVATADHWEARWVAAHAMIARGWERQLDTYRNGLFYGGRALTPARYRAWLARNAISYVALPDAPLDYSAKAEARLVRAGPPYLREVWRSAHWRLFAVRHATPLAQAPARLLAATSDSLTLYAPRPGSYTVRVRFTPYWQLQRAFGAPGGADGCVSEGPEGWTELGVRRAGRVRLAISFSLARVLADGPRCS
ncbi:MAG TPA: hypothetical protein VL979_01885 [Solirubrobacteraceae bacterium]|nr:hypothetical protein [Solirubrobacteraceae bacterium]